MSAVGAPTARLRLGPLLGEVGRAYVEHWWVLVPLALVLLLPQALGDALEPGLEAEELDAGRAALLGLSLAALVAIGLGGEAMYAGIVSALILHWRHGSGRGGLGEVARSLPYGRLIVADLIMAGGTGLGLALLVVPGVIFITYFLLTTVVIEIERPGVVAAMRRSAALVSGHFWAVLALVVLVVAGTELITAGLEAPFHGLELETAANLVVEAAVEPLQGLATVLLCLRLMELRGERPPAPHRSP